MVTLTLLQLKHQMSLLALMILSFLKITKLCQLVHLVLLVPVQVLVQVQVQVPVQELVLLVLVLLLVHQLEVIQDQVELVQVTLAQQAESVVELHKLMVTVLLQETEMELEMKIQMELQQLQVALHKQDQQQVVQLEVPAKEQEQVQMEVETQVLLDQEFLTQMEMVKLPEVDLAVQAQLLLVQVLTVMEEQLLHQTMVDQQVVQDRDQEQVQLLQVVHQAHHQAQVQLQAQMDVQLVVPRIVLTSVIRLLAPIYQLFLDQVHLVHQVKLRFAHSYHSLANVLLLAEWRVYISQTIKTDLLSYFLVW